MIQIQLMVMDVYQTVQVLCLNTVVLEGIRLTLILASPNVEMVMYSLVKFVMTVQMTTLDVPLDVKVIILNGFAQEDPEQQHQPVRLDAEMVSKYYHLKLVTMEIKQMILDVTQYVMGFLKDMTVQMMNHLNAQQYVETV